MEMSVTHERNSERGHFLPKEFLNFLTVIGKKKKKNPVEDALQ
jgi:hypothetical protein